MSHLHNENLGSHIELVIFNVFQDPYVCAFLSIVERHCKVHHLMMHGDFPADHPVEEVGRLLMAVLIKHQGFGFQVIALIDQGKDDFNAYKLESV
jgi:E3 ubiquitin-protein ligase HERC2